MASSLLSSNHPPHLFKSPPSQTPTSRLLRRILDSTTVPPTYVPHNDPDPTPPPNASVAQTTPQHHPNHKKRKWPTKPPTCHPQATQPKTPAPTTHHNKATAPPPLPWAAQAPTAPRQAKARTTTAASKGPTSSSPCSTSSSPCTRRSRATLRPAATRTIGAGALPAGGSARVLWERWLVVVVWIVCSRMKRMCGLKVGGVGCGFGRGYGVVGLCRRSGDGVLSTTPGQGLPVRIQFSFVG